MKVRCREALLACVLLLLISSCVPVPVQRVVPPLAARPSVPASGEFRALIVFVSFGDDSQSYAAGTAARLDWPEPRTLPDFRDDIISGRSRKSYPEFSLTEYFHQQSNGQFTLLGDVYPKVLVTEGPESAYVIGQTSRLNRGLLTEEILRRVDADSNLDLADFDANQDGWLDHLFVVLRRTSSICCTSPSAAGIADLGSISQRRVYADSTIAVSRRGSGSYINYESSGIIFPEIDLVRLMAHEFGHHLWRDTPLRGQHLGALPGSPNGTGADLLGYALMVGSRRGPDGRPLRDARGDATISAFERDLMGAGWISCVPLRSDTTVVLRDLYVSGDCAVAQIGNQKLYLTNRQRIGPFDRVLTDYSTSPPNDHGLADTGLLATLTQRDAMAVLPADDSLRLSISYGDYQNDLFTDGQLTPWTRPALDGRRPLEAATFAGFSAIDSIRVDGGVVSFEFVSDYRGSPVIRSDSWMGPAMDEETIRGNVLVKSGATLTLETQITVKGDINVEPGAAFAILPSGQVNVSGRLTVESGGKLEAAGKLHVSEEPVFKTGADVRWPGRAN